LETAQVAEAEIADAVGEREGHHLQVITGGELLG
jgi:hypothetical protein